MFLNSCEQHFPEFAVPAVRFVTPKVLGTHSVVAMEFARPEGDRATSLYSPRRRLSWLLCAEYVEPQIGVQAGTELMAELDFSSRAGLEMDDYPPEMIRPNNRFFRITGAIRFARDSFQKKQNVLSNALPGLSHSCA
eukprot:s754_g5.t1